METTTQERFAAGFRGDKPETQAKKPQADDAMTTKGNESEKGPEAPGTDMVIAEPDGKGAMPGAEEKANAKDSGGEGLADGGAPNPDAGLHGEMPMGGGDVGGLPGGGEQLSPEDAQREASWKGRLKKMEDDLKARAAELDSREASLSTAPAKHNEAGEPAGEEAGEGALQEMGELSGSEINSLLASAPEEIKAIVEGISNDFGEDFLANFIKVFSFIAEAVAGKVTAEAIGPLREEAEGVRGMVDSVITSFNTMHRDDLEDNDPDFETIVNSPEFEQWVLAQPEDQQGRIVRSLNGGSAARIVRILTQFKDSLKSAAPAGGTIDTSALQAASGVRSTGASTPMAAQEDNSGASDKERFARGFNAVAQKS